MIYRLIAVLVFIVTSFTLFTVGIISDEITDLVRRSRKRERKFKPTIYSLFAQKNLIVFGMLAVSCGVVINYKTIWQYISTGLIDVPWVYVVTGAFLVLTGLQAIALGVLRRILSTLRLSKEAPDENTLQE
jgi:hypothetical protein